MRRAPRGEVTGFGLERRVRVVLESSKMEGDEEEEVDGAGGDEVRGANARLV